MDCCTGSCLRSRKINDKNNNAIHFRMADRRNAVWAHAAGLLPRVVLNAGWYRTIIMWMQCAFGVMLGSELIWKKLKNSGKALIITTLFQSLGTFVVVSLAFGIAFALTDVPIYLAFVFGGIALATAPAPALVQIVQGTIAAAAVINEFIAVIAAKKGFELAGEIEH